MGEEKERPRGWEAQGAEPGGLIFTARQCNEEERAARTLASEEISRTLLGSKVHCAVSSDSESY